MSRITDFCIAECARQNDLTIEAVAGMVECYCFVLEHGWKIDWDKYILCELAEVIKPQNKTGFRTASVVFQNGNTACHWSHIERKVEQLFDEIGNLSAEEWYKEFEMIHPFEDGNGRLGAIFYNLIRGSIDNPVAAPNMFE